MDTARILIATSTNSPARVRVGVAMWLVEILDTAQTPVTRQGFIHGTRTTELELTLKALINAFTLLNKLNRQYDVLIYGNCRTVLNAFENRWFAYWQKEDWVKLNGKPVKHPELWEMLIGGLEPHTYTMREGSHDYSNFMANETRKELERWREALSKDAPTP